MTELHYELLINFAVALMLALDVVIMLVIYLFIQNIILKYQVQLLLNRREQSQIFEFLDKYSLVISIVLLLIVGYFFFDYFKELMSDYAFRIKYES